MQKASIIKLLGTVINQYRKQKKMTKLTIILKGMLLWVTAASIFCFIAGGFESIIEKNEWLSAGAWLTGNIALIYICYYHISLREFYKLSGAKWINKILKNTEN